MNTAEIARSPRPAVRSTKRGAAVALQPQSRGHRIYALSFGLAIAVHASVLFAVKSGVVEQVEFGVAASDSSVEVSLVAALPDEPEAVVEPPQPQNVEPVPEPPPPMPEPEPLPAVEPDMAIPTSQPTPPPALQPVQPRPVKPATVQKPKAAPRSAARGDGSSKVPGLDATTQRASAGQSDAQPAYLRNPHPTYPEEARKAGQEGVVSLAVSVDANGAVVSARITKSSGHPLLDERALSTVRDRWRFKAARVAGMAVSSQVVIPIRFQLSR